MFGEQGEEHALTVGQLLAQVCRITGQRLRNHMEQIGLHRGQGFALVHLWQHDGIAQHELARAMHISSASATNMLQRMERDGWITRQRDGEDQRVVRVYLTPKAKGVRAEAANAFRAMEEEFNSVYSEQEKATLHRLLLKLHDRFAPESDGCERRGAFFRGEEESR